MGSQRAGSVTVVGGGLVGSLLSVFLARRGHEVSVYERGSDLRRGPATGGRSINLVVTSRAIHALERVGLDRGVSKLTVPVLGRMMHSVEGELSYQPYGRDDSECNFSVSRADLNRFLLSRAEECGVGLHFETALTDAEPDARRLHFAAGRDGEALEVRAETIFGTDGFGSAVRKAFASDPRFDESVEMLEHGYKELVIPAAGDGSFRGRGDALHIWPRGGFMLMALPNVDGSFTVTLYLPHRGEVSFDRLSDVERVLAFFEANFPDAVALMPDLAGDFFRNPTGHLGTVRCRPWNRGGHAVLLGDAAHAIVPFFGQGMNCGFEDCTVLDRLLADHGPDWETVLAEFAASRKPDADAIAEMALDNFVEMRDRVGDPAFLLRKAVEHRLEQEWPLEYRSRYSMVTYSNIPYRVALEAGKVQRAILDELCGVLTKPEAVDLARARTLIRGKLTPLLRSRSVTLDY